MKRLHAVLLACAVMRVASAHGRADWPVSRATIDGTAALTVPAQGRRAQAWRFQAGSHVWGYQPGISVWSSAALAQVSGETRVYVGSYDHNLYCLEAAGGRQRWRFTTGAGIYAPPVVWQGGDRTTRVFVGSSDRALYALDAAVGRRLWARTIKAWRPTVGGARLSAPAIVSQGDSSLVVVAHWVWDSSLGNHMQAGGLSAFGAVDGKPRWSVGLGDNQLSNPLPVAQGADTLIYVASENGNLYAIDAQDGRVRWVHREAASIKSSPAAYFLDGQARVIVGSKHGMVRCLDGRTGRQIWAYKTGLWVDGSAAIVSGLVLVGSYDNQLYALDGRDGRLRWRYRTSAGIFSSPSVIRHGREMLVVVAAWDHHLHGVTIDGAPRFRLFTGRPLWDAISLGDSVWASPSAVAIGEQTLVVYGSYSGPLYGLLLDGTQQTIARPASNRAFLIVLPLVLLGVTAAALLLTRLERRRRA